MFNMCEILYALLVWNLIYWIYQTKVYLISKNQMKLEKPKIWMIHFLVSQEIRQKI